MAISPVVTDISELAVGDYIVGFEDMSGHTKTFATKASGSYKVICGTQLPTVNEVTPISYTDPETNEPQTGSYLVAWKPSPDDRVNYSPWVWVVDANCQFLTNATAN